MTATATVIEDAIASLIVGDSNLSSLNAVYRGVPFSVPAMYYPFAVVVIHDEVTTRRFTGNQHVREYSGVIHIEVLYQDVAEVTSRTARVPSYPVVHELVGAVIRLFKAEANKTLGDPALTSGSVEQIIIGDDPIEYGVQMDERENTISNYGVVPFTVRTMEVM